jgi:hypothetical protein
LIDYENTCEGGVMVWTALACWMAAAPVLVLEPEGEALRADEREALGAELVHALERRGVPHLLGQEELAALLNAEARRQSAGCSDASCAAEIAEAMGAERAVASRVARIGDRYVWHLIAVDAREGRVLARSELQGDSLLALAEGAGAAVAPLADALGAPFPWRAVLWPTTMVTAAVVVAGAGLAYDLTAPSSKDRRFDAADLVGPAAYVVAAGLLVTAIFNPLLVE